MVECGKGEYWRAGDGEEVNKTTWPSQDEIYSNIPLGIGWRIENEDRFYRTIFEDGRMQSSCS